MPIIDAVFQGCFAKIINMVTENCSHGQEM